MASGSWPVGLALILLLPVLAGCIQSEDPALLIQQEQERQRIEAEERAASPVVAVDEDLPTGSVVGKVIDDELRPVANATVTLVGFNATARTTSAGEFRFGRVNAGEYFVIVKHKAFHDTQVGVSVRADETADVSITLEPLPVPVARVEDVPFRLYMSCRGFVKTPVGTHNLNTKGTCVNDPTASYDYLRWANLDVDMGLVAVLAEAQWTPTTDLSRTMRLGVGPPYFTTSGEWESEGRSPIGVVVDEQMLADYIRSDPQHYNYWIKDGIVSISADVVPAYTGQVVDAGLAMNQLMDVSVQFFYVTAPEEYDSYRRFTA